ncbi:hypothetical protein Leucomu_10840 [Leucobacter muris]|uniref:Uncharacterized protein n=1 Tax=Leucobacter muris TaxID=1935379 RepID=A0ABX5QH56_9MICO|nr:hypothetical protein Leucomu_10840 [Leucobacter muris]
MVRGFGVGAADQRPNRRESKPPREACAASVSALLCVPPHQSFLGTEALTAATCWPQPAQVVLPQTRHRVGRHMGCPFAEANTPGGIL